MYHRKMVLISCDEMEEFSCALEKLGVNCKIVQESDFGQGFPSKDFANWFKGKGLEFQKVLTEALKRYVYHNPTTPILDPELDFVYMYL